MILWWIIGAVVLILLAVIILGSIIEAIEDLKEDKMTDEQIINELVALYEKYPQKPSIHPHLEADAAMKIDLEDLYSRAGKPSNWQDLVDRAREKHKQSLPAPVIRSFVLD